MLFELTVPAFVNGLKALSTQLGKALEWGAANDVGEMQFITARLAPDMFPLAGQVRFSCAQAIQAATRLGATGAPDLGEEAVDFEGLQAQIAATTDWLSGLTADTFNEGDNRQIGFALPNGMAFDMTAAAYGRDWALPQFYFHLIAAYSIMRHMGVPVGKADYLPYMMQYLRPGTAPAG